ncbi:MULTISPECIES: hypothetical protein [Paenarthrobacter]|uniref:hypothetical protein n=1 Tax=Paenarthrobacter TaxID=1742992 RepID=UPI001FB30764|nr:MULTISPECIES: hypothetical protein [Paenarthrobacter]MCW3767782.1 hypothetical protein [Paenarthrobacter sp. PAE-2]UOD83408.1 hypothetical protein MQZ73_19950 [Paenarthrobacter ureafaciens]WNZ05104.1 hypothetical protein PVT25_06100 [Paenarthrobacter ureafaciens]
MAAQQLVVCIVDGDFTVEESIRRPVRLTPDGYAGIVFAGAVYPVFDGNLVDISGASWEIEDCNRFLFSDASVPYAPRLSNAIRPSRFEGFAGEWALESNRFGHHVVFNASERAAAEVIGALEAADLSVQRWDVSHRTASDGKFYDWFARLRLQAGRDEVIARVSAAFSPSAVSPLPDLLQPEDTRLEDLTAQVERLLDQTITLQERLTGSELEVHNLRQRLKAATDREAKLSADLKRSLEHQKTLRTQIATLANSTEPSNYAKELLAEQKETEELLEFALSENAELHSSIANWRTRAEQDGARIVSLKATMSALQDRIQEFQQQEGERRRTTTNSTVPRRGVLGFLDTIFSRLVFVLDGAEVLANVESPASLLRSLVQIDMGENLGKDLEGVRGWREISKLSTGIAGSEDMGRLYYKPDGNRVLVSVHIKQDDKEQRRHIDRLRSV